MDIYQYAQELIQGKILTKNCIKKTNKCTQMYTPKCINALALLSLSCLRLFQVELENGDYMALLRDDVDTGANRIFFETKIVCSNQVWLGLFLLV